MSEGRDEKGRFVEGNSVGAQFAEGNEVGKDTRFGPGYEGGPGGPVGNDKGVTHGGEGALVAIREGRPFKGIAASEERSVKAELQAGGRAEMVKQEAVRLKTACNLYWGAVCKAADDADLEGLDKYIKRYGWLAGATLRAWAQVKDEDKDRGEMALDYAELVKQLEAKQ